MQPKQCIAIIDSIKAYAKQNPTEAQVYEDWFQAVVNLRDALPQDKRFDAYKYSGELRSVCAAMMGKMKTGEDVAKVYVIIGRTYAINLAIMQEGNARQAGQTALATQLASCCCENKQLIGDLKYTIATEDCATRQAIADNARAIVDNCNANFRSMMDYFTQDKIATLTAENQSLKFAASQDRQNALLTTVMSQQTDTILNRVNPRPIPAYQVANPNVGVNCCGCC